MASLSTVKAQSVAPGWCDGEDRVVGLNYSCGNLGVWVNREFQLGLLAVINGEMFHHQGGKPRTSSPTKAVKTKKP